jgi:tetratricopeptide (TPR) repeat protein
MASSGNGDVPGPLRRAREARGWSVKGVAARLTARLRDHDAGQGKAPTVTPAMVRAWERGYPDGSRPQARHRKHLCALYDMTEEQLGIDRPSWPWPRHKPAKETSRAPLVLIDQSRTRYDSDEHAASTRMGLTSRANLLVRAQRAGESDDMERQKFLKTLAALGAGATVETVGRLLAPADVVEFLASGPDVVDSVLDASGVTDGTLADIEMLTADFWQKLYTIGFSASNMAMIVPLRAHLGTICRLLDRPEQPAVRRRLCVQAAQMNDLLRVAASDLGLPSLKHRYAMAAYKAACQSETPALAAQILACGLGNEVGASTRGLSVLEGPAAAPARAQVERVLGTLKRARMIGEKFASPWTFAQIRSLEAQAYGRLGWLAEAEASLEAGERALEQASPEDRPFLAVGSYSGARFASGTARTYLRLGMPSLAQAALRESLDINGERKSVNRAVSQLALTLTYVQQGELDTALDYARPACELASELRAYWVRVQAHELRLALAPHRHVPEVQQLDDRLRDLAA